MAKITDLAVVDAINGDEFLPIVQRGATKRATMSALRALIVPFLQNWYKGDRGDAGPAGNVAVDLAELRAAPITNRAMLYAGSLWTFRDGDYTGRRDAIASSHRPIAQGAWISQNADDLIYRPSFPLANLTPLSDELRTGETTYSAKWDDRYNQAGFDHAIGLKRAHDALVEAGGGVLRLPRRALSIEGSIAYTATNGSGVSWRGEGERASALIRVGNSTAPLFDVVGPSGDPTEVYTSWSDFAVWHHRSYAADFNPAQEAVADAFRFTRLAKFKMRNLDVRGMQVALRAVGSLVFQVNACNFHRCKSGYLGQASTSTRADGSTVTLYPNAIDLIGNVITNCCDYGVDQTGSGLSIIGGDISFNGTTALATSGGVIFRAGSVAEIGSGIGRIIGPWMESNLGTGVAVEGNMGAMFTLGIEGVQMIGQEAGRCLSIGSGMFAARDCRFPTAGDKLTIAAVGSILSNVYAGTIIDTTPIDAQMYDNVNTADGAIQGNGGNRSGLTMANGAPLRFRGRNGALDHSMRPDPVTSRLEVRAPEGFDPASLGKLFVGNLPNYADSAAAAAAMGPGFAFRRPDNTIGFS